MFREGKKIGNYTLIKPLGRGGFGEVWLAERRSQFVTKKVAIKLPLDEQVDFESIRKEAELWEQASGHANVLPIIDADIIDGQVVIVSEYADGGSLADKLKSEGKLSIKEAVEMTVGILNGLEFLHNKHIIHRDIKPANILLQSNNPRLTDFGISRAMQTPTISSTIIGTDAYMSPESFDGKRSVQTDVWSVGVVLYQLLTDKLPFSQEHPSERMFAIIQKEFQPLPNEIPQNLQQIIKKALAKLPENRFQTTSLMRESLEVFLIYNFQPEQLPNHYPAFSSLPQTQEILTEKKRLPLFLNSEKTQNEVENIYQKEIKLAAKEHETRLKRIEQQKRKKKEKDKLFNIIVGIILLIPLSLLFNFNPQSRCLLGFLVVFFIIFIIVNIVAFFLADDLI